MFSFPRYKILTLNLKQIILSVFFVLTFQVFQYFPGLFLTREVWIFVVFLFLIFIALFGRWLSKGFRYQGFELYILLLCIMPIYSAISANLVFGQPFIYGVLAQRSLVLAGAALLLLYLIQRQTISLADVEKTLILLGWLSLLVFSILVIFLNPEQYSDLEGFVGGNSISGYRFKFTPLFAVFTFLYYFSRGLSSRSTKDYFLGMIFLYFLVFLLGGRSLLVALLFCLLILVFQELSWKRVLLWFSRAILVGIFVLLFLMAFKGEELLLLADRFDAAFTVVLKGEISSDPSANARLFEVTVAWPYIQENWLLGNGDLSQRWENGYQTKLGYFHPSDIGLVGVIYVFGFLGTLIFLFQFLFAWQGLRGIPKGQQSSLIKASKGFLIYLVIHSMVTGQFVHSVESGLMFVTILYVAGRNMMLGQIVKPQFDYQRPRYD